MGFFGGGGAGGVGGSTGATDNAILRADGTGAATLQNSALNIDDPVSPFSITGVASTDIITAVGHNFTTNQGVIFPSLTGGAGLTASTTVYFVMDISGDTFKVSTTSGGAAVNFTTDITEGTVIAIQANAAITNQHSETNSALVLTPKGTGAFIVGPKPDGTATGGNARGTNSICINAGARTNANQVASGNSAIAIGATSRASGNSSVALGGGKATALEAVSIGPQSSASNLYGVAIGRGTSSSHATVAIGENAVASGISSCAIGGFDANATAQLAVAFGERTLANRYGMMAMAAQRFSTNGDAQWAKFVLRCKTTTNAAVEMALDGSTTYLTIPSGKVIFCNIKVVGVKSDGATVATYQRQYAAKNVAGTSTQVYAAVTIGTDNAAGTSLAVSTNDTGDYISIQPTGVASETWRWVASVDAVEVAYGT